MDNIDPAALSLHPQPVLYHARHSPSPTPSTSSLAAPPPGVASIDSNLPPKPDRSKHDAIKARYKVLQNKWHDLVADRTKLASDLEAAEQKREKLQAEADMLIEQMHELAPDISLAPDYVDLSSDDGGDDPYDGYTHKYPLTSSSYFDGRYGHRRTSTSDNNVPSSSINYFSGQLFGPNSGLDFESDLGGEDSISTHSKRSSNGHTAQGRTGNTTGSTGKDGKAGRLIMLSPEQAREEEVRIEEEQKARERSKSYNPDNVKVRIGVMPATFVHPLVQGNSNRSSKSRSPSTSDNASAPMATAEDNTNQGITSSTTHARPAKRPRTMSKEKSPVKEPSTIKEEDEPNPP